MMLKLISPLLIQIEIQLRVHSICQFGSHGFRWRKLDITLGNIPESEGRGAMNLLAIVQEEL